MKVFQGQSKTEHVCGNKVAVIFDVEIKNAKICRLFCLKKLSLLTFSENVTLCIFETYLDNLIWLKKWNV